MRVLLVGVGGVGTAITRITARRSFFDHMIVTDYDLSRAEAAVDALGGEETRFSALRVDASDRAVVTALLTEHRCGILVNVTVPRFVMPLFEAAPGAGVDYLDLAMPLSAPHPERPYEECGVKLGDGQFARAAAWEEAGRLALVGMGVEPAPSDAFARYAADALFGEIEEIGVRDGADLTVDGYDFAPSSSTWTTIRECLNPPVIWEKDRGWFTTAPFSEPKVFDLPAGIGPVECVNVEHKEVLLISRWVKRPARGPSASTARTRCRSPVVKCRHVVWSRRVFPARPHSATVYAAGPAPEPGSGARGTVSPGRCTSTTSSTTSGRCASTAPRRWSGRRPSIPSSRCSWWRTGSGTVRASWAPRPCLRAPSSTCSSHTGHPGLYASSDRAWLKKGERKAEKVGPPCREPVPGSVPVVNATTVVARTEEKNHGKVPAAQALPRGSRRGQ